MNNMTDSQTTETELMRRLASGEIEVLSEIVKKYQDKVLSLAYRFLNDWTKSEDIAQETFLRIYKAAGSYKPQAKFNTWLYRIVVNLCLDEQRKQSKAPISIEEINNQVDDSQSNSLERKETVALVQNAINELPERQKLAVILHRYESLSYDQISEVTQWSKSAVESLLVRAYANLREKLKKIENNIK